jgi:hypothetical protein
MTNSTGFAGHNWGLCKKCGRFHIHPKGTLNKHWKMSEKSIEKMSKKLTGRIVTEKTKENMSKAHIGTRHSDETKRKMSKSRIGVPLSGEHREKISIAASKLWKDPKYREKVIKNTLKSTLKRPTHFEKKIIDLCSDHGLPFKYIGDGQVIIAGKNPDFMETNGRKLLIETYGKYWHPIDYEETRFKLFAKYGFRTLFLNDDSLIGDNWKEICLRKIKNFLLLSF